MEHLYRVLRSQQGFPEGIYPLLNISQLIDATSGHELLSFMDTISRYNQIKMNSNNWEKTSFITHWGVFENLNMPFRLINVGATFQRMMDEVFSKQIGRNMVVYVDVIILKSRAETTHIAYLQECFNRIRQYKMKFNPIKCSFGLSSWKFLVYLVSQCGIEADPTEIQATQTMTSLSSLKKV